MSQFAEDLKTSLSEAIAHAKGEQTGVKLNHFTFPDVRLLREKLHMSQTEFAKAYHIPLATLQGWEQGRRRPDKTASAYLSVIAQMPDQTRAALT